MSTSKPGPRTAAGIDNCKYNAIKHGLTGAQIVLKGEDPAQYDALRQSLFEEHQPQSEDEAMLVERIAQSWWKLTRAELYEKQFASRALGVHDLFDNAAFTNFLRYKKHVDQVWKTSRRELAALKAARTAASTAQTAAEATDAPAAAPPESVLSQNPGAGQLPQESVFAKNNAPDACPEKALPDPRLPRRAAAA